MLVIISGIYEINGNFRRDLTKYFKENYDPSITIESIDHRMRDLVVQLNGSRVFISRLINFDPAPNFKKFQIKITRVANGTKKEDLFRGGYGTAPVSIISPQENRTKTNHCSCGVVSLHCPVCLDMFSSLTSSATEILAVVTCGHVFCKPCIINKTIRKCPVCQSDLGSNFIRIYL